MSPHPRKTRLDWKELLVSIPPPTALHYRLGNPDRYLEASNLLRLKNARSVINLASDNSESALKEIMPRIKKRVVMIEFARATVDDREFVRGAFLLDADENVIVHVTNALLGYDGNGPLLSRRILEMFGFTQEMFETVNNVARAANQRYAIAVDLL